MVKLGSRSKEARSEVFHAVTSVQKSKIGNEEWFNFVSSDAKIIKSAASIDLFRCKTQIWKIEPICSKTVKSLFKRRQWKIRDQQPEIPLFRCRTQITKIERRRSKWFKILSKEPNFASLNETFVTSSLQYPYFDLKFLHENWCSWSKMFKSVFKIWNWSFVVTKSRSADSETWISHNNMYKI